MQIQEGRVIMLARRAPIFAFALAVIVLAGAAAYYLPFLPDRMATHFGVDNAANGWSSKRAFVISMITSGAVIGILFASAGLLRRLPTHLINLPRKDYWLAAERRAATLDFVCNWTRWLLIATFIFLAFVFGTTIEANRHAPPRLTQGFIWAAVGFGGLVLAFIARVFHRFR